MDVIIAGAGIGGLTLALMLQRRGIDVKVFEAARRIEPVGVGISLLPHAMRELCELGLEAVLAENAVQTRESCFYNRFGQFVYREAVGRSAGYSWPQLQIHRGVLQRILLEAFLAEAGPHSLLVGHRLADFEQDANCVTVRFAVDGGQSLKSVTGRALIGCDGIHSAVRQRLHPGEGGFVYSGVNMWRGTVRWPPFLTGASYVRAGWLTTGKMVIYPISPEIDVEGRQLINWVAEVETPDHSAEDWNSDGKLADFIGHFADWHFDFLDVPAMIRATDRILEYPMVDKEPLDRWSFGRVTLLGDAAHPMYPRGSNGAGQAMLDARALADSLAANGDVAAALAAYEGERLAATSAVIRANRAIPPDVILREVYLRTQDRPFENIDDVLTPDEMAVLGERYKKIAGYDRATLGKPRPGSPAFGARQG